MKNNIRFQLQARDIENRLLAYSTFFQTDYSEGCNSVSLAINEVQEKLRQLEDLVDFSYFDLVFQGDTSSLNLEYFKNKGLI